MTYYRVPVGVAGEYYHPLLKKHIPLIADELLTPGEVTRMRINRAALERIEVPKKYTYIFFGARFATEDAPIKFL